MQGAIYRKLILFIGIAKLRVHFTFSLGIGVICLLEKSAVMTKEELMDLAARITMNGRP